MACLQLARTFYFDHSVKIVNPKIIYFCDVNPLQCGPCDYFNHILYGTLNLILLNWYVYVLKSYVGKTGESVQREEHFYWKILVSRLKSHFNTTNFRYNESWAFVWNYIIVIFLTKIRTVNVRIKFGTCITVVYSSSKFIFMIEFFVVPT